MYMAETKDVLVKSATRARRRVRDMVNYANDEISDVGEVLGKEIRTNPVRSTIVAFGVGAAIAVLFYTASRKIR